MATHIYPPPPATAGPKRRDKMITKNCEPPIGNKTAYDRGAADSYYGRAMIPHILIGFQQVLLEKGTQEWDEYMEGYACNEDIGNFKDWGTP